MAIYLRQLLASAPKLTLYLQQLLQKGESVSVMQAYMLARRQAYHEWVRARGEDADKNHTLGVAYKNTETLHANLVGQFLPNEPLFQAVGGPEFTPVLEQINAALDAQSKYGKWRSSLSKAMRDMVIQDLGAVEVVFNHDATVSVNAAPGAAGTNGVPGLKVVNTSLGYTSIKRLDLFRCLWDTSVPPEQLADKGDFFAYSEPISFNQLSLLMKSIGPEAYYPNLIASLLDEKSPLNMGTGALSQFDSGVFSGVGQNLNPLGMGFYRYSDYGLDVERSPDGTLKSGTLSAAENAGMMLHLPAIGSGAQGPDFTAGLQEGAKAKLKMYQPGKWAELSAQTRTYVHSVIYFRALPKLLGIQRTATVQYDDDTPLVFRADVLNGNIVMALRIEQNRHGKLPVLVSRLMSDDEGSTLHSFQERTEKYQNIGSKLIALELAALNRMVVDRAIVDPELIDPVATVRSKSTGKIILRRQTGLAPRDITRAYYQIPFVNNAQGVMLQSALALDRISNDLVGQNPVTQGQFVPGNKTNEQFQATVQGAGMRMYPIKLGLEDNFFHPLKFMIKALLLDNRNVANVQRYVGVPVQELSAEAIEAAIFSIQLGDGLESPDRLAKTAETKATLSLWAQAGALQNVDLLALLTHLASNENVKDFTKFRVATQPAPQDQPTDPGAAGPATAADATGAAGTVAP